jgi:hypothetical protein
VLVVAGQGGERDCGAKKCLRNPRFEMAANKAAKNRSKTALALSASGDCPVSNPHSTSTSRISHFTVT